jgi:hypothetical protein
MSNFKTSELNTLLNKLLKENGRLRHGNNLQYHCPFCNHHKKKLEVCLDLPNSWHCWVCDAKGRGVFSLLRRMKAPQIFYVDLEKIEGIKNRDFAGSSFSEVIGRMIRGATNHDSRAMGLDLPIDFRSLAFDDGTLQYRIAKKYAIKRKLSLADIVKYNIGYCTIGPYANRIVFPSYDASNSLNFYSCRNVYDDNFYKYKNSEVSKDIIGFENLIDFDFPIYLCEGALDAISVRRNAIPLFGNTLSKKLKTAISNSNCPEINIVLDDDALPRAIEIAEFLLSLGKNTKLVQLEGKDPNVLGFEATIKTAREARPLDFSGLMKLKLKI